MFNKADRVLKTSIQNAVSEYFKNDLQEMAPPNLHVKAVANLIFQEIKLKKSSERKVLLNRIKTGDLSSVKQLVENVLISPKTPWQGNITGLPERQMLIHKLLTGQTISPGEIKKDKSLLSAVAWKKNTKVMGDAKALLQTLFDEMFDEIKSRTLTKTESEHFEMIIGDLLALYPYLMPKTGSVLSVPLFIEGKWQKIDYQVEKLQLTSGYLGSPLMAFGLTSKNASPLLLFKGTTYPTDKGFSLSLLTDINPFASVGAYTFKLGKKKLDGWLKKHASESKAIVYGKSLGGALGWRTAITFPSQISKAVCYGAPGFSSSEKARMRRLHQKGLLPPITIYCQENDPVPYFDLAATKYVNYYRVVGNLKRGFLLAHAEISSVHSKSMMLKLNPTMRYKNGKRVALTAFRTVASAVFFPLALIGHFTVTAIKNSVHQLKKIKFKRASPANS